MPESVNNTLTRRSFVEWVGRSAVLSLGAGLLARCQLDEPTGPSPDGAAPVDGAVDPDAAPDASTEALCEDPAQDFPFTPAQLTDRLTSWPERTVDHQDLTWILQHWRLTVDGMVHTPRVLTFKDLLCLPRQDQEVDFHCVEGWSIYDVPWNGVHLSELFARVKPLPTVTHVTFHTIGGTYNESLPLAVALEPKTLLAYGIDARTIPLRHGFPLRIVIPRLLGYKNAKFVHRIELTDQALEGFWVQGGYPYDGEVPEARLRPGKY